MDRTRWIIFAVIVAVVVGGLFFVSKGNDVDVSGVDAGKVITEGEFKDNIYGSQSGKVTLVEYGDFQCPGCGSAYPSVKALKEKYEGQLTFVFRNFPLTNIHPNALAAATAAEAAGRQGKFWQMHDLLFERQTSWQNAGVDSREGVFQNYARELGLDIERFKRDLGSEEVAKRITYHRALANKVGADSTPTFTLNGRQLENDEWNSAEALEKTITDALKKAGLPVEGGMPAATEEPAAAEVPVQ